MTKQHDIDSAWELYQRAMDACEDLEAALYDLENEHGINSSEAYRASVTALTALSNAYDSPGILPPHSDNIDEEDE